METLVIHIPDRKIALVKCLLKELGVTFDAKINTNIPNALTAKTIEDAQKGIGLDEPIVDIKAFMSSI